MRLLGLSVSWWISAKTKIRNQAIVLLILSASLQAFRYWWQYSPEQDGRWASLLQPTWRLVHAMNPEYASMRFNKLLLFAMRSFNSCSPWWRWDFLRRWGDMAAFTRWINSTLVLTTLYRLNRRFGATSWSKLKPHHRLKLWSAL